MEKATIIRRLNKIAADIVASATGQDPADVVKDIDQNNDNFLNRYNFNSIDSLEYLLAVEEELGISFADEDLSEALLGSEDLLADYVVRQLEISSSEPVNPLHQDPPVSPPEGNQLRYES